MNWKYSGQMNFNVLFVSYKEFHDWFIAENNVFMLCRAIFNFKWSRKLQWKLKISWIFLSHWWLNLVFGTDNIFSTKSLNFSTFPSVKNGSMEPHGLFESFTLKCLEKYLKLPSFLRFVYFKFMHIKTLIFK